MSDQQETQLALLGGSPAVTIPHPPSWPVISTATRTRIESLLTAGDIYAYGNAPVLEELEAEIRAYHGTRFALATSSGTAAIHSALVGLGIEAGDEVVVPAYTFHATMTPVFLCNAVPVLCDVDPELGVLDPVDLRRRLTDRTKVVVVNHLWGHPVDMDSVVEAIGSRSVSVIEDCSHAHGATYHGKTVGSIGRVGAFSMGAKKMVSGGMAGALVTDDLDVYERALLLGHAHERAELSIRSERRSAAAVGFGANYRIHPVAAVMCTDQLRDLDHRIARKTAVLDALSNLLRDIPGLTPPITRPQNTRGGWYGYKALYDPSQMNGLPLDQFVMALRAEGLLVGRPSSLPLHRYARLQSITDDPSYYAPGSKRPVYSPDEFPGANEYYQRCVSFPATRLWDECSPLLRQYGAGIRKIAQYYQ